jgi:hypothetical protein
VLCTSSRYVKVSLSVYCWLWDRRRHSGRSRIVLFPFCVYVTSPVKVFSVPLLFPLFPFFFPSRHFANGVGVVPLFTRRTGLSLCVCLCAVIVCVSVCSVCLCVFVCLCVVSACYTKSFCGLCVDCPSACEQARVSGVDASVTILHESPAGSDHNQRIISFSGNDSSLFNASPVSLTQPVPLANKSSPFAINASSISPQTEAVQRPESNFQNRDASEIPHSRMARGAIQLSPKESRSDRAGTQDSDQAKETRQSESSERGTSRQCITNASPSPSQR